jgi:quinol-cytochrome oxidoreductase complex cytochrome b subunit
MILLLRADSDAATEARLLDAIRALGLEAAPLDETKGRALEIIGDDPSRAFTLRTDPAVERILTRREVQEGTEPLWPHGAVQIGILFLLLFTAIMLLTAFAPPGLGDQAEIGSYSDRPSYEWYLRPLAAFLRLFESAPWLGGTLVLVLWLGLALWPFIDRLRTSSPRRVLLVRILGVLLIALALVLALKPLP